MYCSVVNAKPKIVTCENCFLERQNIFPFDISLSARTRIPARANLYPAKINLDGISFSLTENNE